MVKRSKNGTASAAVAASRGSVEYDIENRKAEMARIADEAEVNDAEASAPSENPVSADNGDDATDAVAIPKPDKAPNSLGGSDRKNGDIDSKKAPNPFDPASLRLDQSFADTYGVKKLLTTVPVGKPKKQDFMRVHPDPRFMLGPVGILTDEELNEDYLVVPKMVEHVQDLPGFRVVKLFTAINRQGVVRIWPIPLPGHDGKYNEWHRSAMEAAERAMKDWVRVTANRSLGAYEIFKAPAKFPDPVWPEEISFDQILKVAFRERIVDRPDHPLVQRLRGMR